MALTQSEKDRLNKAIKTYGIDKVKEQIKSSGRAGELLAKANAPVENVGTINPPTNIKPDINKPVDYTGLADTGMENVFTNEKGTLTTGFTDLNLPVLPEPKGATEINPIVDKGTEDTTSGLTDNVNDKTITDKGGTNDIGGTDLRVTKLGEVLSDAEKRQLKDAELARIRGLTGISFEERNKMFQKLNEDVASGQFYGGETLLAMQQAQADDARKRIEEQTGKAITSAEDLFRKQLEADTTRIREQGQKVMDTTQRLNSLRGGGRSSANEADIMKQQGTINDLISAAQQQSDLKLQERKMQIEGASAEAMAGITNALAANTKLVNEKVAEAQKIQLDLNNSLGSVKEAMDSSLGILEAAGEDIAGIDREKSAALGIFVNSDGTIYTNKAGNPIEFKTTGGTGDYTPLEIDAFAQGISSGNVKLTDLKLDPRDVAKVLTAMNLKLDNTPALATTSLKAERLLKDLGLGTDAESIKTVTNLLKVNSVEDVKKMIQTDDFKNASFVAGNQKLFDDLRKDSASYKDIKNTYTKMNDIWSDFKNNPSANRAAMEQALVIMFNKMLDPGSVVREGEFDRTSQGQSVINAAEGWLQRLEKGGAGIKDETFKDIVNIAKVLNDASQSTVDDLKSSYAGFAGDLGADPAFVNRFFEVGFEDNGGFATDELNEFDSLNTGFGGGGSTGTGFKSSEGFNIDFSSFNKADQTAGTKGIPVSGFVEKINLARTGNNVGKDANNPGNITADGVPKGQTKEQYGKAIGATGTYLSPNGREYFVFPSIASGGKALERDIMAKLTGGSRYIKPDDTLARFQRVYVGETLQSYLDVLKKITGANENTPIKNIDPKLLTKAVMKAEGFTS